MFNPEFRYLIAQDNVHNNIHINELINADLFTALLGSNVFISIISVLAINILLINTLIGGYKIVNHLLKLGIKGYMKILCLFTPGDKWQELALIATIVILGAMMFLTMNEFSKKLDDSFTRLKTQIKEKDAYITELELELKSIKSNIKRPVMIVETFLEDGGEVQDEGEEVQDEGEEVQDGGEEVQDEGEEVQDGGEEVQNGGEEVQDRGEEVQDGGEEVQDDV
jgi:archaellum component FlaC